MFRTNLPILLLLVLSLSIQAAEITPPSWLKDRLGVCIKSQTQIGNPLLFKAGIRPTDETLVQVDLKYSALYDELDLSFRTEDVPGLFKADYPWAACTFRLSDGTLYESQYSTGGTHSVDREYDSSLRRSWDGMTEHEKDEYLKSGSWRILTYDLRTNTVTKAVNVRK